MVLPQSFRQLLEFGKQGIREIALILENVKKTTYAPLVLTGEWQKIVPDLEKVAKSCNGGHSIVVSARTCSRVKPCNSDGQSG